MSGNVGADVTRREKWAASENQRRTQEYNSALAAWTRDDDSLAWMLQVVRSGSGFTPRAR